MVDSQVCKICGTLKKIVYKNPDNDYFIGRLQCEEDDNIITIVGYAIEIQPGERIITSGKWVDNKKYGRQFEIENIETLVPVSIEGIKKYLGSGLIKGIGPVMAGRIVTKFGFDTLNILDKTPEKLTDIEGFAAKRIELVAGEWNKQKYIREIMIFMQSYGISNSYAIRIYNIYSTDSVNILKSNPYRLIEDVTGIGFKTADRIAENMGIEKDSVFRIKSGIMYLLNEITDSGHCYYPYEDFMVTAVDLLQVGENSVISAVKELAAEQKVILVEDRSTRIYLKTIYEDENYVSGKLKEINDNSDFLVQFEDQNADSIVHDASIKSSIELDGIQFEAVKKSIHEKILVITGSPGTGKSTILNTIIKIFEQQSKVVLVAAPTGRASKRLTEATGHEAKTIHRLLKFQPRINRFLKNETDNLNADLIIIDEASMMDIRLFRSLLKAIDKRTRLILVGDVDQLPAVGPGNVLSDIINSAVFPVVRLEKIYRQGGKSQIIYNAHKIRDGIYPSIKNSEYNDFYFIEKNDPEDAVQSIINLITKRIPSSFDYKPLEDIQVIVPTNRGLVGVNNLNTRIQESLNKTSKFLNRGSTQFRIKDKVIQLKNNYEKEVFNGDIGFIHDIDFEMKEIIINYEGRMVKYDFYDTDQLSLSYAISIHKSQGSEFKCVIIPILTSHYMLLQRNLLYTAITRAKEVAILVGSKKAIGIAVNKNIVENRYTGLKSLLAKF